MTCASRETATRRSVGRDAAGKRTISDSELEMLFPSVPWRDPIMINDFDGNFGFACRFCIACHGIRGCDIPSLSMSA